MMLVKLYLLLIYLKLIGDVFRVDVLNIDGNFFYLVLLFIYVQYPLRVACRTLYPREE